MAVRKPLYTGTEGFVAEMPGGEHAVPLPPPLAKILLINQGRGMKMASEMMKQQIEQQRAQQQMAAQQQAAAQQMAQKQAQGMQQMKQGGEVHRARMAQMNKPKEPNGTADT